MFANILSFFLIIVPLIFWIKLANCFALPKIVISQLIILFLLACYLIKAVRERRILWRKSFLFLPVGFFLFWSLVTLPKAVNIHESFNVFYQIITYLIFYFLLLVNLKKTDVQKIIFALLLTGSVISLYGILQHYGIDFIAWHFKYGSLSTLGRYNFTAEYLVTIIPLGLIMLTVNGKKRFLFFFAMMLMLFCLLLTQARASWLALFVSFLFILGMLVWRRKLVFPKIKKKLIIIIPLLIFLLIPFFLSTHNIWRKSWQRAVSSFDFQQGSVRSRLLIYRDTLRMVKENPVLGVGLGNFKVIYPLYQDQESLSGDVRIEHVHNEYLQIAVESGIIGLSLFFWFLLLSGKICWHLLREEKNRNLWLINLALTGGLIAILVNALFAFPLQNPSVLLNFWLFLGIMTIFYQREEKIKIIPLKLPGNEKDNIGLIVIISLFLSFLIIKPLIANYYFNQGLIFSSEKNWRRAGPAFKKAILYQPSSVFSHFHYGGLCLATGKFDDALREFQTTLKLRPNYPQAHGNLAIAYAEKGLDKKALNAYQRAIFLNPKHAEFFNNLGGFYFQRGEYRKAISQFRQAVKLDWHNYRFHYNLGFTYFEEKRFKEAISVWEEALRINPKSQLLILSLKKARSLLKK